MSDNCRVQVVVCVKPVPDPASVGIVDPVTKTLARTGKLVLDDADRFGIELALQLVANGGDVMVVSMTPASDHAAVRTALAMGAARATVVTDERLEGADSLTTSKVLAAAIRRSPFDLVIAGTESSDGYTGTLPVQLAELLGIACVSFATSVTIDGNHAIVRRQTEAGHDDVLATLPALVTLTAGSVRPRYPNFKGIMAAKAKPLDVLALSDLKGLELSSLRVTQHVTSIVPAPGRAGGEKVIDDGSAHERIVTFLEQARVI